ncbi:MAG TPA: hypothetical protein VMC83_09195 [Streptosporangiaceae bacterium]|jgi:hypothetical protein|nr:hypothetical protein [Streptosporangiaceae bacterium]
MFFSYQLYQAGRVKSPRELLDADARAGERAKAAAGLWHALLPARHRGARYETGADEAMRQSCVTAAR